MKRNNYKKPRRLGIKKHIRNDRDANIVYSYSAYGATLEDIASILGMDDKTVTKYYKEELVSGKCTANGKIAQRLYNMAIGKDPVVDPETNTVIAEGSPPNLIALIFLAKTRLGWRETKVLEQTVDMKTSGVQIYLPDNGMTSEDLE